MTLIEVLVAMSLVALATLALLSANTVAARASSRPYRRYLAMRLAQQRLESLMIGDMKTRLLGSARGASLDEPPVFDSVPQDCSENGVSDSLCNTAALLGWVDVYGRPCTKVKNAVGYQNTCQFRRYIRYVYQPQPASQGDVWYVRIVVSYAPEGGCTNFKEGDPQCVVTSAALTR